MLFRSELKRERDALLKEAMELNKTEGAVDISDAFEVQDNSSLDDTNIDSPSFEEDNPSDEEKNSDSDEQ